MKLIFLDVDGTLCPSGTNTPPDSALEAMDRARAAGHKLFLCSGRNRDMLEPLFRYGFDGYIASAGGYVVCGEELLFDCPMPPEEVEELMDLLAREGVYRMAEALDGTFSDPGVMDFLAEKEGGSELARWRRALEENLGVRPMSEYDGRRVYKLVFLCESPDRLLPVRERYENRYRFVLQDSHVRGLCNGELINRRFDKGRGVRRIAEKLGVPLSDAVGFGDSMNDLELIETAGVGVCMANGSETLKARADWVCPALEEDGLAQAFERFSLM